MDSSRALGTAFHDDWFVVIRHMPAPDLEQISVPLHPEVNQLLARRGHSSPRTAPTVKATMSTCPSSPRFATWATSR